MDTSSSSLNTGIPTTFDPIYGNDNTSVETSFDIFTNLWTDDTLSSLGAQFNGTPYVSLSSNPRLPSPNRAAPSTIVVPSYTYNSNQSTLIDRAVTSSPGNEFLVALQEQVKEGTLSQERSQELLFYYMHPDVKPPEDIQTQLQQFPGASDPSGGETLKNIFDQQASTAFDSAFERIVQERVSSGELTQTQANQAIFTHYHRSADDPLTNIEQQALDVVSSLLDIPKGTNWIPPTNTDSYDGKLMASYDSAFEKELTAAANSQEVADLAATTGLSKEQIIGFLKYQHYFSDATITEFSTPETQEAFKNLLNSLNGAARAAVGNQFSIPDTFQIETATVIQERIFNGTYTDKVVSLLHQYKNTAGVGLTADEMNLIASYFNDPEHSTIPDNLKAIAQQIQESAIASVKNTYNLPAVWAPNNISAQDFTVANSSLHRGIASLENQVKVGIQLAQNQGSPEREVYMSYLTKILSALQTLREQLYANEVSDSEKTKAMSSSKLDQTLEQLATRAKMNEKIRKKEAKAKKWGVLGKIFQPIMKLATMLVAAAQFVIALFATVVTITLPPAILATGPALAGAGTALALSVMGFIDSVQPSGKLVDKFFGAVDDAVKAPFNAIVKTGILIGVVMSSMTASSMDLGPAMLEKSGIIQAIVKAAGGSEQAQELAAMIVSLVITLTVAIVMAILTAGAGLGKMAGDAMKIFAKTTTEVAEGVIEAGLKLASFLGRFSQSAARGATGFAQGTAELITTLSKSIINLIQPLITTLEKFSENSPRLFDVVQALVESFQSIIVGISQIASGVILADVAKIKGTVQSDTEIFEALIAILQKVLQNLLNNLPNIGDFTSKMSSDVMNMFDKLSQQMTAAHQA